MALKDSEIAIDFGLGIDTKSDPKVVVNNKLLALQNGVFTQAKKVAKRNGYTNLPLTTLGDITVSSPKLVAGYVNELVMAATGTRNSAPNDTERSLYSYSTAMSAWINKGYYSSVGVSNKLVSSFNQSNVSQAVLGNYTLSAYLAISGGIYYTVTDHTTHTNIVTDQPLVNGAGSPPKCVTLGGSTLAIAYVDFNSALVLAVFDPINVANQVSVQYVSVSGTPSVNPTSHAGGFQFDLAPTQAGGVIAWSHAASVAGAPVSIKVALLSAAGVVGTLATVSSSGYALPLHVNVSATNANIWIYWCDNTTPASSPIYYATFSQTLSVVTGKTVLASGTVNINGSGSTFVVAYVRQMAAIDTSFFGSSTQTLYFSIEIGGYWDQNASTLPLMQMFNVTAGTGQISSANGALVSTDIYGRIFTINGIRYLPVMFRSFTQSTGFLLELDSQAANQISGITAKFLYSSADGVYRRQGFLATTNLLSSTKAQMGAGIQTSSFAQVNFGLNGTYGSTSVVFDLDHPDSYQSLVAGNTIVLNGGYLFNYDGNQVSELGFHVYPERITGTQAASGVLTDGTYLYYVVYSYVDQQNNLYESTPGSFSITTSQSNAGKVTLTIPCLALTAKPSVNIDIYRSDVNGTVAYFAGSVVNNPLTPTVQFVDNTISYMGQKQIYITGGVVHNSAPPCSLVMMLHQNRIWAIDSENPETDLWYSKTIAVKTGVTFSNLFIESFDGKFGKMRSVIAMDEKVIVLKDQGIFFFVGDGANDSGTGATISSPQVIPCDVGCAGSKGTILFPLGVMFKTTKGIYLLDRSLNVSYFGASVEAFNSQDITDATMLTNVNHIRFLTSSGSTLVFDYFMGQWSTFTNHQGTSSDTWNGTYVYARTDGKIFLESLTSFLDDSSAYALSLTTAWLKTNIIQGWQRIRRLLLLGNYATANGTHGIQVQASYDFSSTLGTAVTYVFTGSTGLFQFRERLPDRQKCQAVSLTISELTSGASGEQMALTDMTFDAALKKGAAKLPASQSVG